MGLSAADAWSVLLPVMITPYAFSRRMSLQSSVGHWDVVPAGTGLFRPSERLNRRGAVLIPRVFSTGVLFLDPSEQFCTDRR
jgi:hypothetical protein